MTRNSRKRIAFDLDETLGVPVIDSAEIVGFRFREGCDDVLQKLEKDFDLILWTVSNRSYVEKILGFGLRKYFSEVYCWEDISTSWKDVRRINADFLIDDSRHHFEEAAKNGIAERYIVIEPFGSPKDFENSLHWIEQIEEVLFRGN
jgi:phosphoglycolate phosphatase-like HAD superfamily hydrolase